MWSVLEVNVDSTTGRARLGRVNGFLLALIILSTIAVVLETVEGIYDRLSVVFVVFEIFTVAVFTVEYLLRFWSCVEDERYCRPFVGRLRYAITFYAVVDFLAIFPFYLALLPFVGTLDLRFLRLLRLMRSARVLKVGRYSEALDRLKAVFRAKLPDLGVVIVGVLVALVLASSIMYHVENAAQPDKFSSIPAAMWWGVSALTTVGYGDIQPITPTGKVLGGLIQILGISLFALPAGILAAGYEDEARRRRAGKGFCHVCGQALENTAGAEPSEGET